MNLPRDHHASVIDPLERSMRSVVAARLNLARAARENAPDADLTHDLLDLHAAINEHSCLTHAAWSAVFNALPNIDQERILGEAHE